MSKDGKEQSTPPSRRGRHARTPAVTNAGSPSKTISSNPVGLPTSTLGLPPGVDPLTLDADDAFSRFSVREVQSIESSLRTSHDALTSRLRLLVSERYRDMLGTANTLIDMSDSSSNLVNRLENVLKSIKIASDQQTNDKESLTGVLSLPEENGAEHSVTMAQEDQTKLFAIVATTKLIAEAPDEVWIAIDSATQAENSHSSQNNINPSIRKDTLPSKELSEFRAATVLRATWIYVLAQASWTWLQDQHLLSSEQKSDNIQSLFPYISRQHSTLLPMRNYLLNAAKLGLSGQVSVAGGQSKGQELATSYLCTITSLISLSLLESASLESCRKEFLEQRKGTLIAHVKPSRRSSEMGGEMIIYILRFISDTLIHSLRAFALPANGENLSILFDRLQNANTETTFPPTSMSALLTLPSAAILSKHLPQDIYWYKPKRITPQSSSAEVLQDLRTWSTIIREEILAQSLPMIVEKLNTVSQIGQIQSGLGSTIDRCILEAQRYCSGEDGKYLHLVQNELSTFIQRIETLLLDRIKAICQTNGEELSDSILHGTRTALQELESRASENANSDLDSSKFLFETSTISDLSSFEVLEQRLRSRTQSIQGILALAERKMVSFANETKAYASSIRKADQRRKKRKGTWTNGDQNENGKEILANFDSSLQHAKSAITKGLRDLAEGAMSGDSQTTPIILFLIRLISALRHSNVFRESQEEIATDLHYSKQLAEVQNTLLRTMSDEVIKAALETYENHKEIEIDNKQSEMPSTTSTALMAAMTVLSRSSHSVGFGYRSEAVHLRVLLVQSFFESWINSEQKPSTKQDLFDLEYLQVILGIEDSSTSPLPDLSKQVEKTRKELLSKLDIGSEQWSQHLSSNLPGTLSRTRLVVASIIVNESIFSRAMNSTKTAIPAGTTVSIPPLPMLRLASPPESIPRIRPAAKISIPSR